MNSYTILLLAIAFEVVATSALKLSYGFSKLYPSLISIVGYSMAFWLMSLTLKQLPVSIVYAIWSGLGIIGITLVGALFFLENYTYWHFLGTVLTLAGVLILSWVHT